MNSKQDKEVIDEIRAVTSLTERQVISVFKAFSHYYAIGNYSDEKEIHIPYFGNFYFKYKGDILDKNNKRTADVDAFFTFHDDVIKNIGVVEDWKNNGKDDRIKDLEGYKDKRKEMEAALNVKQKG